MAEMRAVVAAGIAEMQATVTREIAEIGKSVGRGLAGEAQAAGAGLGTGRRGFSPRIDATESEDEKVCRSGGFKGLGHFALTIQREGGKTPGLTRGDSLLGRYNESLAKISAARAVSSPDGMYETSEPDGGALVPPDFTTQIWERIYRPGEAARRAPRATRSAATRSPCRRTRKRAAWTAADGVACSVTGRARPSSSRVPGRSSAT